MKCSICGGHAAINMRQHRLRLCEPHFVDWFVATTGRTIDTYGMFACDDKVLVAVSGGKDSLTLWDALLKLGYQAEALYIGLGIDGELEYSGRSLEMCQRFAERHEAKGVLHVVDVGDTYGQTIPELAHRTRRGRGKPCSVCGLVKRHVMNRVARDLGFSAVATGHNLDDEVAVLLQNTLHWQVGYLARQAPVLAQRSGLARKVKPLVRFHERETAAYALVQGIDYIYDECPFATGSTMNSHKELLNQLELRSPGAKQQFYLSYLRAKAAGQVTFEQGGAPDLHPCTRCSQPTTAGDLCAFCRLWD